MRAAAIFGLGSSTKDLKPFQDSTTAEWTIGLPASPDGLDAILVFGGDGTVHRHLGALVKLALPVLVVPAGSGNDFARALGLRTVQASLAAWRNFASGKKNLRIVDLGRITPIDSAQCTSARLFSCVAGVGLDGEISRRANALPRWLRAHGGYALSLPAALARFHAFPLKLSTAQGDGDDFAPRLHQTVIVAVFANTPVYGGGMRVAPRALMDDGQLDVCIIRNLAKLKLLGVFPSVYFGKHLGLREVEYFVTPRVRVETEHPMDVYADGEHVCRTPVEVSAVPKALPVIVPT